MTTGRINQVAVVKHTAGSSNERQLLMMLNIAAANYFCIPMCTRKQRLSVEFL